MGIFPIAKQKENHGLLFLLIITSIILSVKATTNLLVIFLILLSILWILRYPSKAAYLLAFTIPLSPHIALSESAYTSYGYLLFNLNDLIVFGLLLSLFLNFCLQKRSLIEYPLLKANIAILVLYLCLLIFTGLGRPINEFVFQLFYLSRYALYFMIGFYVWKYLPIKDIEKHILILFSGLLINSGYTIYDFVESVFHGRYLNYALTPRVSGFWGIIFGAEGYHPEIGDPNNFAMYVLIALIINILYLFYKTPKPSGIKKKLAITSLFFGFIALHITMSRAAIYAFWGACLFLLIFKGKKHLKRKIISSISLISLVGILITYYIGIDIIGFFVQRLYLDTSHELTISEGRFSLTVDVARHLLNNITEWWGHGISSQRFYVDELFESGIVRYKSKSLYNGYLGILWDAGLIGIIVWVFWLRKHFTLLSKIEKQTNGIEWLAVSLKVIVIGFLIGMFSTDFYRNFRLMGYFSFLTGLLVKSAYQNFFIAKTQSK